MKPRACLERRFFALGRQRTTREVLLTEASLRKFSGTQKRVGPTKLFVDDFSCWQSECMSVAAEPTWSELLIISLRLFLAVAEFLGLRGGRLPFYWLCLLSAPCWLPLFFPLVRPITLWGSVLNLPVCYSGLDHHSSLVSHHPAQSRAMCPRLPASIPNTYFHACSPIGNIAKCRSKYSCVWAVPTMVPCLAFQSSCLLDEDPYISCMRVARPSLHPVHYLPIPCTEIGAQHVVWHAYCTLTFLWGGSLA